MDSKKTKEAIVEVIEKVEAAKEQVYTALQDFHDRTCPVHLGRVSTSVAPDGRPAMVNSKAYRDNFDAIFANRRSDPLN